MVRLLSRALCLVLALSVVAALPALAQGTAAKNFRSDVPRPTDRAEYAFGPLIPPFIPPPPFTLPVAWWEEWICGSLGPAEVQGFRVRCNGASYLDVFIADCCVPGDHWQIKSKNWDTAPNSGVTTSPGPANVFGAPSRTYNYGGTAFNPGNIDTYVECSMLHGVDLFAADSFVVFASDGNCAVFPDPVVQRIDRAP